MEKVLNAAILLFLMFYCPLAGIGQEGKQQIGLKLTPSLSYRTLNGSGVENGKAVVKSRNRNETTRLGYELGLNYLHPITKKFSLRPGLSLSSKGYKYAPKSELNNSYESLYYYNYVGLLLRGQYSFSSPDHWHFFLAGGVSINLLLDGRTQNDLYHRSNNSTTKYLAPENLHDRNYQAILGFGFQGPIAEHFNLAFEPVFKHSITRIGDGPIKTYLWSLGAEVGVYYEF